MPATRRASKRPPKPAITVKRSPALTQQAREMFEAELFEFGWQPGGTIPRIAEATGLTLDQARDAIFAPSADVWRRALTDSAGEVD